MLPINKTLYYIIVYLLSLLPYTLNFPMSSLLLMFSYPSSPFSQLLLTSLAILQSWFLNQSGFLYWYNHSFPSILNSVLFPCQYNIL